MKEISKFLIVIFFIFFSFASNADSKVMSIGNPDAKVTVKVFSSLTCPHCANFHSEVFNDLKKDYIDKGLVKFEHHAFPLDLAALNAEIVVRCHPNIDTNFKLLNEMYNKQKLWAVGSDINKINDLITKIGEDFGLTKEKINKCLKDDEAQDEILNQRIEAQKNYKINSTPTIFVNEIKYTNEMDYKMFKKVIEKNL